jgi:undecaprenyl-diphosphatase
MAAVSDLHSQLALCIYAALFAIWLARGGERRWAWTVALVVPTGLAINVLLKNAFHRARPHFDDARASLESYSFPSGHTAGATLLYGVIAAYLMSRTQSRPRRIAIAAAAFALVALVGFSRMYLGLHYLSDVVAAMLWAVVWVAACVAILSPAGPRAPSATPSP